jgi:hypothetical protein
MPASGAINVVAILNGTLHRVYVKLGNVAPGQTVDVCRIGRRCEQNLQVGLASNTFLNIGAATAGTITVGEFAPAEGRMNVTFNNVVLPLNQGADRCTLSGSLATAGFSQ